MHCPRLDHFVKLRPPISNSDNYAGLPLITKVITPCCHMTNAPKFDNYDTMMSSDWLQTTKNTFNSGIFPVECVRCERAEDINIDSIRTLAIEFDKEQTRPDYLIADVVLDNICNSACQFCAANLSTKIGSLESSEYVLFNNTSNFLELPLDRIVQLDLTGGEPSNSKNVKNLLKNLPANVTSIRLNTNCSSFMDEIIPLVQRGIRVSITISLDGIANVHDYVRWPIGWNIFHKTLLEYKEFASVNKSLVDINLWTTLNTLNVGDLPNIIAFAKDIEVAHLFSELSTPRELNIEFSNSLTRAAKITFKDSDNPVLNRLSTQMATGPDNQLQFDNFVKKQDLLRGIDIANYIELG